MWQTIFTKLKDKGLNPYAPGQHTGKCTEKYCVIREGPQVPYFRSNRTGYRLIEILVFVPLASYIQIKPYMDEIKTALAELSFLRKTGNETPIITDNEVEAYTTSIEYQIIKKLEG